MSTNTVASNRTARFGTRKEVSEYLGVSVGTMEQWATRHQGPPYVRFGRGARYDWTDVEKWLSTRPTGGEA